MNGITGAKELVLCYDVLRGRSVELSVIVTPRNQFIKVQLQDIVRHLR